MHKQYFSLRLYQAWGRDCLKWSVFNILKSVAILEVQGCILNLHYYIKKLIGKSCLFKYYQSLIYKYLHIILKFLWFHYFVSFYSLHTIVLHILLQSTIEFSEDFIKANFLYSYFLSAVYGHYYKSQTENLDFMVMVCYYLVLLCIFPLDSSWTTSLYGLFLLLIMLLLTSHKLPLVARAGVSHMLPVDVVVAEGIMNPSRNLQSNWLVHVIF